jgi:hypothetical protein
MSASKSFPLSNADSEIIKVQSSDDEQFRLGVQQLQDRISASEEAESNLARMGASTSREDHSKYLELVRKGLPLLGTILKCLGLDSRRDEGKQRLFELCDDWVASQTIRGPPVSSHPQGSHHQDGSRDEVTGTKKAIEQLNKLFQPPSSSSKLHSTKTNTKPDKSYRPSRTGR